MSDQDRRLEFPVIVPEALRDEAVELLLDRRSSEARTVLRSLLDLSTAAGLDDLSSPRGRGASDDAFPRGSVGTRERIDGLLVAVRDSKVAAAIFGHVQAGRTALLWPPRIAEEEPAATGVELVRVAVQRLVEQGVCVVQACPEPEAPADAAPLEAAGFRHVTDLLYLVSLDQTFPTSPPASELEFEPYRESQQQRLGNLVEQTYQGTLDCPQLNGVRASDDVLAGYRATGVFDPGRWFLVREQGEDVGCLLLAEHPESRQWELVYVGLVPSARGRGLAAQTVRHAQWLARQAGARQLVLAVDADNAPALRVYAEAGFVAWDRRPVYLQIFPAAAR